MLRKTLFFCVALVFAVTANAAFSKTASAQPATNSPTPTTISKTHKIKSHQPIVGKTVNINTADIKTLAKLKGISRGQAKAIVTYRDANGPFQSVNDLAKVKYRGINQKFITKMAQSLVTE